MPSDAQRIAMVKSLLQSGHKDKILVSHDVVCKHELRSWVWVLVGAHSAQDGGERNQ